MDIIKVILPLLLLTGCAKKLDTYEVSVGDFAAFVESTGYMTDSEKFGWGIVMKDVSHARPATGANWKDSDGDGKEDYKDMPVTQVSYYDACKYCEWAGGRLPTQKEWLSVKTNLKNANIGTFQKWRADLSDNMLGNVYEYSRDVERRIDEGTGVEMQMVRVMGGSAICQPQTCAAYLPNIEKWTDLHGGNNFIGFRCIR